MSDEEDTITNLIPYATSALGLMMLIPILRKFPRQKGSLNPMYHAAYFLFISGVLFFVPEYIKNVMFSPGGVLVIGTVIPIYESITAACSIDENDDTAWLQFWIASGTFTYCTEWVDVIADQFPTLAERWYEFEFLTLLWLLLPFTDGSGLLFSYVIKPFLAPVAQVLKEKTEGKIKWLLISVNATYLWFIWMTFMTLDEEARRFVVIAVGTIYPLAASIVAVTTTTTISDDTYWLIYWSCFSILFIIMDYLENFVGHIRGFYSICLCATVYLFLPMFQGADAVFRNILVPLSGQYETMLLRDVFLMKAEMVKSLSKNSQDRFFQKASQIFLKKDK